MPAPKNKNKPENTVETVEAAVEQSPELASASVQKPVKTVFQNLRELVEVSVPAPGAGEDPNYFLSINGKAWLLPRGKTSKVPRYVAMAYKQAEAAKGVQMESQSKLLEQHSGGTMDLSKLSEAQIQQLKALLGIQ